jgi:hypothetical protein
MMPNLSVACSVTVTAQGNGNELFGNQPSENDFDRKLKINEENNRMWSDIMNELSLKLYSRRYLYNMYSRRYLYNMYSRRYLYNMYSRRYLYNMYSRR